MAFLLSPGVSVNEIDLTTIVPAVSTSVGAIAGIFPWGPVNERTLVDSETTLVNMFGKPSLLNAETFFTASSFLSYANALWVVRAANTTDSANGAYNAIANVYPLSATIVSQAVKSATDYYSNKDGTFDGNTYYVARYPGALGNSLRISICDSTSAYSSNVNLAAAEAQSNGFVDVITPSFTVSSGSNTGTITFSANVDVSAAVNAASVVNNSLAIGDLVTVGNSTIGTQILQISSLSTSSNSTYVTLNISFTSSYLLPTNYVANTSMNGNSSVVALQRAWQYSNIVSPAPTTTTYQQAFGNTAAVDMIHVVVIDQRGLFTNSPGTVLERYQSLSRATDSKLETGASNYYKTYINQNSNYVWWASPRAGAPSNTAVNLASTSNVLPVTIDFAGGQDGPMGFTEANATLSTITSGYDLLDRKSTRLNSSHIPLSRMPSSA